MQLFRVPVSGGGSESILDLSGPSSVRCASAGFGVCILSEEVASANGKQLIFSVVDPERGRTREVTRLKAGERLFWGLSPEGTLIALVEGDNVRLLNVDDAQIRSIHPNPPRTWLHRPGWSSDAKKLFVPSAEPNAPGRILVMELDGRNHVLPLLIPIPLPP